MLLLLVLISLTRSATSCSLTFRRATLPTTYVAQIRELTRIKLQSSPQCGQRCLKFGLDCKAFFISAQSGFCVLFAGAHIFAATETPDISTSSVTAIFVRLNNANDPEGVKVYFYQYFTDSDYPTFDIAEKRCIKKGRMLGEILTLDILKFCRPKVSTYGAWTAGFQISGSNTDSGWVWRPSQIAVNMSSLFWSSGEPNDFWNREENRVTLFPEGLKDVRHNEDNIYGYLCQKNIISNFMD